MRLLATRVTTYIAALSILCSSLSLVNAQQSATTAKIKIDTDRAIGEIHPHLFGNFTEHLGRMIYGGIYEENSPLSDQFGYRKDVFDVVKQLNVSILRWPGGNFASGYNWKDGIGPKDQRPTRIDLAWNDLESNRFGTDEFLRYCEMLGTEPYICINVARTAAKNLTKLSTGHSEMRLTVHGKWETRVPMSMQSLLWKLRKQCDLWTAISN